MQTVRTAEAHSQNVGFTKHLVAQTCQLIAAILHLGNLEFTVDWGRDVDAAIVHNQDVLALVAELLSITPSALETPSALSYKTKLVKKELCTVFLDPDGACEEPTNGPFRYSEAQGDGAGSKCEQGLRGEERSRTKR
jgi:hypothetical protein